MKPIREMKSIRMRLPRLGAPSPITAVLAAAIPIWAAAGIARAADHPLTLAEAIDRALHKNEEIAIGRESLTSAEAAVSGARGAYDPFLGISGGWQRSSEPVNSSFSGAPAGAGAPTNKGTEGTVSLTQLLPTGGVLSLNGRAARQTTNGTFSLLTPAYETQAGVSLRQPLLRGLATDSARTFIRVARSGRMGAQAELRSTVTETVAAVEQTYWSLVSARRGLDVLRQSVGLAQQQLEETQTRVQSGTAPETEVAEPRAELERRTGDELAARESVSRAENQLKLLILGGEEDPVWPDSLVPVDEAETEIAPVDLPAAMDRALRERPELASLEAAVEQRRAQAAFARNAVWPSLDAVLSYDRFGLTGSQNPADPEAVVPPNLNGDLGGSFRMLGDGDFNAARIALVLGFPIRNRTARAAAVSARSAQRQAEAALERERKAIRAEVLDAAAALETASQRIAAARAGREAAEVQLKAESDRFEAGLSTNFLVLTRQNDLSRARLEEISSLTDYRMARTEMSRATGSLLDERGITEYDQARSGR